MRSAYKSIQRENLHHHLVLAYLRGLSVRVRPTAMALVLTSLESYQFPQEVPQAHGSTEPRKVRQENVQDIRRTVSTPGRRARSAPHRQELQPGGYGRDHVGALGPLQAQPGRRRRICLV